MKKVLVIMAGGAGLRVKHLLNDQPKQFVEFEELDGSLFDHALDRVRLIKKQTEANIVVLMKAKDELFLKGNLSDLEIIFEDESINGTTSAMFSLIHDVSKKFGDTVFAFFPSDHLVLNDVEFSNTVSRAIRLAEKSKRIFLLGSKPKKYISDFGYIIPNQDQGLAKDSFFVKKFIEKPSGDLLAEVEKAEALANLGVFVGTATSFLCAYLSATTHNNNSIKNSSNFDKDILENFVVPPVVIKYDSPWYDYGSILLNKEKAEPTDNSELLTDEFDMNDMDHKKVFENII